MVTQQLSIPYPSFTSYLYKVYETIPPLVTSWYTIWAKVIVIVATYRRVVTRRVLVLHVTYRRFYEVHSHLLSQEKE